MSTYTINIAKEIDSIFAIDFNKARDISKKILTEGYDEVWFDFDGTKSVISSFIRELISPLLKNTIRYKFKGLEKDYIEMTKRIENESKSGIIDFRNIDSINS